MYKTSVVKTHCEYCNGMTFDDKIGHCIGCGAPRNKPIFEMTYSPSNVAVYECSTSCGDEVNLGIRNYPEVNLNVV